MGKPKKKELPPALRENAEKLKAGIPLHGGGTKAPPKKKSPSTKPKR